MKTLFDAADRVAVVERIRRLRADSPRQWGTMDAAQMLAHCAVALGMACGDGSGHESLVGKLLLPFSRRRLLGETPFSRNAPTGKDFVISDPRDFARERRSLLDQVERFAGRGPEAAGGVVHDFFARLSGEEWGRLLHKHLDHHLRQFGN